jgi:hypothetical protein
MSEWIRLQDSEWTPEKLSAEIANRSLTREIEFGPLEINVPPFKSQGEMPQQANGSPSNADLFYHLRALTEMPNFEMTPVLGDSPTTQFPWIGNYLGRVRVQFHHLVLFYINRAFRQQSRVNRELIASLDELTKVIEGQHKKLQSTKSDLPEQIERRKRA